MPDDALETILRLVADGRLTADEAGPILDALESPRPAAPRSRPDPTTGSAAPLGGGPGRAIRLEVTDAGRKVVGLRVPGLTEATTDRIREAIESGMTGPIVAVDDPDGGGGVRIVIE
jgi:hypothetical protein